MISHTFGRLARRISGQSRYLSDAATNSAQTHEAWLFVDSVFPIQLGRWDIRRYICIFREDTLLEDLESRLATVKSHNFKIQALEPHKKDGGVFVRFQYSASDPKDALGKIETDLRQEAEKHGGLPSWLGLRGGSVWMVKGSPWREDMNRFASPVVRVAFEGPDVHEQSLYQLFRPYGRIRDLTHPTLVPAGTLRSSTITFRRLRSATIARNVVHGLDFPSHPSSSGTDNGPLTRLRTAYMQPIQAHIVRDWMSNHPRIVIPVLVFLLGTLTYTIFDPIRALMVQGKVLDWFDYRESNLYKWLIRNTFDRLSLHLISTASSSSPSVPLEEAWKERKEAEGALKGYLSDLPTTVAFVHGPQGSGKSRMLQTILKESERKALVIDCRELHKVTSDTQLVGALARQTGYWPVFTFLNSMNSLIDLASVGLIGQKAGLSSSLTDQLQQILDVVATGLKGVSSSHRSAIQRKIKAEERSKRLKEDDEWRREEIKRGTWHDGRLDCVAGNGVMSELGIGDEGTREDDMEDWGVNVGVSGEKTAEEGSGGDEIARRQRQVQDLQVLGSLPIVVIKNYAARSGSSREELLAVLAQWAATLAENQVAHVIVLSDNRENAKRLAKALPSKPLNSIALYDADATSALSFVKQKLRDADINLEYTKEQTDCVGQLGGRASDLESLIHKVRSGQRVEEAVEDIINRGVGELRKNAFGDDVEDAKNLPWSREQAWAVLRRLSTQIEIPYHDVLLDFPFKGDEMALKSMEHAELIAIGTSNGRPSTIRPGKPVYKYVFERLVQDPIFQATQDIAFNEKAIASAENTIKACEQELTTLKEIGRESTSWWGGKSASSARVRYLFDKMLAAETKVEVLDKRNVELKKMLAKGG